MHFQYMTNLSPPCGMNPELIIMSKVCKDHDIHTLCSSWPIDNTCTKMVEAVYEKWVQPFQRSWKMFRSLPRWPKNGLFWFNRFLKNCSFSYVSIHWKKAFIWTKLHHLLREVWVKPSKWFSRRWKYEKSTNDRLRWSKTHGSW